ncbi:MAG: YkgJ family cysteine cluster protein [Bacteroidia bacterium]
MVDLEKLPHLAKKVELQTRKIFTRLKKQKPAKLNDGIVGFHEEVFEEVDCLTCANCCKTTSPAFYDRDIERLAKFLRMKPVQFIEKYLRVDEDKDYVLRSSPCLFLGADNYCSVYEARPLACREYPHTNRKRFHQILDITLKNTSICPAAFLVVEKLNKVYS